MKKNTFIAISGILGSGKTTAALLLTKELGMSVVSENFDENEFLPRFYKDMGRWAFHSQTFFLIQKMKQLGEVKEKLNLSSVILDTPIVQDVYSYAQAQYELGNMDKAEWKLYLSIYETYEATLPKPDLIIYLETAIENLLMRIGKRGRKYEQNISADYLELLGDLNKKWLEKVSVPIVYVDTNELNIVSNKIDQSEFVTKVRNFIP